MPLRLDELSYSGLLQLALHNVNPNSDITCLGRTVANCPPSTTTTNRITITNPIPQKFAFFLHLSLSAIASSTYCRPHHTRPSKWLVVECLYAHECLTSETFLVDVQSDDSCPTSPLGSPDRQPGLALLIDDTITYHWPHRCGLCSFAEFFFAHPSSHQLFKMSTKPSSSYPLLWTLHGWP